MTAGPATPPATSRNAVIGAALVVLEQMGLSPADLAAVPQPRREVPAFAAYIPVVAAAVSPGTRRAYGPYRNRVTGQWGSRRLDEPAPSDIRQLMTHVKTHVVARRNARGGRSAAEHLVAALRCVYRHAEDDGLISPAGNPARKVAKPRRLPSTRRAVPATRPAEIDQAAATTGNDPELDTLLLRLHTETACRRGGALALRPEDLDPETRAPWAITTVVSCLPAGPGPGHGHHAGAHAARRHHGRPVQQPGRRTGRHPLGSGAGPCITPVRMWDVRTMRAGRLLLPRPISGSASLRRGPRLV